MKKIVTSMCMLAVVALAFTSCKKNEENTQAFAFNHSTEQLVSDEGSFDKVYLDQNLHVNFEDGDQVMVFDIEDETGDNSTAMLYTVANNATQLTSSGTFTNTAGNFYAFYPGGNVTVTADLFEQENQATFTLQPTQVCRIIDGKPAIPENSLYMAAKDETHKKFSETYFDFKNICGVLSCKFYSPSGKKVTSIEVTDHKYHLTGDVTLKIHAVDPVEMTTLFQNYNDSEQWLNDLVTYETSVGYSVDNAGSTVTLDCGDGVELGETAATATRFFIVLRPLALVNGCDIVVTFDDGDTFEINSDRDNRIKPNVIRNIAAVNVD